jgi:hypothetical protein
MRRGRNSRRTRDSGSGRVVVVAHVLRTELSDQLEHVRLLLHELSVLLHDVRVPVNEHLDFVSTPGKLGVRLRECVSLYRQTTTTQ